MKLDKEKLGSLFISTLYLSAFTFGGGYVIVTLMKQKFVDEYHWIDQKEMLDLVAIAQSTPGAIAVNGAIVVGYKLAGLAGVLVAILATILPPFLIISLISFFYEAFAANIYIKLLLDGMQAGVGAVIATVVFDMGRDVIALRDKLSILIMFVSFIASYAFQVNVIYVVLVCGMIGTIRTLINRRNRI